MQAYSPKILAVDDESLWLDLISRYLQGLGYNIITVGAGQQALDVLHADPCGFDLVILDKFMEGLNGMEVLRRIKADADLKVLPVILATGDAQAERDMEGIRAGAYYYLVKPFSALQLRAVVTNALNQYRAGRQAHIELLRIKDSLHLVEQMSFGFRTPEQARTITAILSSACGLSMVQEMGLLELMLNAVEHGNLGISYVEKGELLNANSLDAEIDRRLILSDYADRTAVVKFRRCGQSLIFNISDQGVGFDWRPYMDMQLERINDKHGRGIAVANKLAFTHLSFRGAGNSVEATIVLN